MTRPATERGADTSGGDLETAAILVTIAACLAVAGCRSCKPDSHRAPHAQGTALVDPSDEGPPDKPTPLASDGIIDRFPEARPLLATRALDHGCFETASGEVYCLDEDAGVLRLREEPLHLRLLSVLDFVSWLDDQGRVMTQGRVMSSDGRRALVHRPKPTPVVGLSEVVEVMRPGPMLARHRDGTVSEWHSVAHVDRAGTEDLEKEWYEERPPKKLPGVKGAIDLESDLILTDKGDVLRWRGDSLPLERLGRVPNASSLALIYLDTLVVTSEGAVKCLLPREREVSGTSERRPQAWVDLPELSDVAEIGGADNAFVVRTRKGGIWSRKPGMCGTLREPRLTRVKSISNVVAIGGGSPYCFIQKSRQVACWGKTGFRMLGSGDSIETMVPERMRLGVPLGERVDQE